MTKKDKILIKWQKRFISGEQNTKINAFGEIVEIEKYGYRHDRVYNLIYPFFYKLMCLGCAEPYLYGKNGSASRLIPYQQRYNKIENQLEEMIEFITNYNMIVEDDHVDLDNIVGDGVTPGKVFVYKQGAAEPSICSTAGGVAEINCLKNLRDLYKHELEEAIKREEDLLIQVKAI